MAPVTTWGRVFCILFGLVGIPLTLSVIAALGTTFANTVSGASTRVRGIMKSCGLPQVIAMLLSIIITLYH